MEKMQKFVIGIRTASKMFRLPSLAGVVIDSVLSIRGSKRLAEQYYSEVATNFEQGAIRLQNTELGNTLIVDISNVIFSKDAYIERETISIDKVIDEFSEIWPVVNNILKIQDVRRIGLVAEHQISQGKDNPNKILMNSFSNLPVPPHPAKFHLRYEERRPTKEGLAPDIDKSDFVNIIYDYYDSELDADHSRPGAVNANLDVQRYYSPLLTSRISDEVKKLTRLFNEEKKKFDAHLNEKGVYK